jgi:hypothetical protein
MKRGVPEGISGCKVSSKFPPVFGCHWCLILLYGFLAGASNDIWEKMLAMTDFLWYAFKVEKNHAC